MAALVLATPATAVATAVSAASAPPAGAVVRAAPARSASRAEVAELAREAIDDDRSLARLREIDVVDGRPVDLRGATSGFTSAAERRDRLVALAEAYGGPGPAGRPDPTGASDARQAAHDVVNGRDYRARELPKPFRGVLHWLGERLAPVGRLLAKVFGPIWRAGARVVRAVPGGELIFTALLAGLFAWLVVVLARRRSRAMVRTEGGGRLLVDLAADPADLDREAAEAEAAGDFALAVRRRYEAGLLRLVRAGRLTLHPETTARKVADEVGDPDLAGATTTFEDVVYGGDAADVDDVRRVQAAWLGVLGAKASR